MGYAETKVYFDGSHYIAIPHTSRPSRKRYKRFEETVEAKDENNSDKEKEVKEDEKDIGTTAAYMSDDIELVEVPIDTDFAAFFEVDKYSQEQKKPRRATRKEIFEELYKECMNMSRKERKRVIMEKMRPYFDDEEKEKEYVNAQLERKMRNLICRRVRMCRKANLQNFNYFCTFTYDDKKHDEESFRRKLKIRLSSFANRRGWKYIGVWERSPTSQRLHFHGIFYIPEGTLPGYLMKKEDYSTTAHKMQIRTQSSYFNEEFGRSDFEPIEDNRLMGSAMAYLMKYIEKTGEKIVYSKGLPQYFISDIMDDDVVCTIGQEDRKLLLFDNFNCIDEGCYIGEVSPEVIEQMRKCN